MLFGFRQESITPSRARWSLPYSTQFLYLIQALTVARRTFTLTLRLLMRRLAIVLSLFQLTLTSTVNITVDDEFGDPNGNKIDYQPPNAWLQGAIGGCSNCSAPISSKAYNNTFHGSYFNQNNKANNETPSTATFTFFGTSVSVNCFVSGVPGTPFETSNMTFFIDGAQAGNFLHGPKGIVNFHLKTVFVWKSLSLQNHTLIIANGRVGGGNSLVILDSINYFQPSSQTASSGASSSVHSLVIAQAEIRLH
ncbi:hypothetical protein B0H19DRAFT_699400 [Mycena capillaripes]|nr:hypothetical protein B0H19DRAFT_699400 [Mycena capillaripes]